jgi:hypothetical protein
MPRASAAGNLRKVLTRRSLRPGLRCGLVVSSSSQPMCGRQGASLVDHEIAFVGGQPIHHFGVRRRPGGLAEHVHVNQVGHSKFGNLMSSIVSAKGSGLNQPLTGQANRSFTKPTFLRRVLRLSRYSPRSIRSTSNCWPGWTSSCCRISAGRTICPLLETVVVTCGEILSYLASVKRAGKGLRAPCPAEIGISVQRTWDTHLPKGSTSFNFGTTLRYLSGGDELLPLSKGLPSQV